VGVCTMRKKIGLGILTFLPLFAATVESRACIGHFLQDDRGEDVVAAILSWMRL